MAALPLGNPEERAFRIVQAMRKAQARCRSVTARAVAAGLLALHTGSESFPLQRDGLRLALQLALMECDLSQAQQWRQAWSELQQRQSEPELQRQAGSEPFRQWRLELVACPQALTLAQQSVQAGDAAALKAVLQGIEHNPQATSLAFALLLLLLRRQGNLDGNEELEYSGAIPPNLWLLRRYPGSSAVLEQRQARWQALHHGWQLQWLDHQPEAVEAIMDLPELVQQACLCALDPAIRGNLLRLWVLWRHGGVALERGVEPLQGLAPLLAGRELLLVQDEFGSVGSALWAATPQHPWVGEALELACRYVLEGQGYSRWDLSGACLLSGITARQWAGGGQLRAPGWGVLSMAALQHWLGIGA